MTARSRAAKLVVDTAMAGVRDRADVHYTQDMRLRWEGIHNHIKGPSQPHHADCSSYTTWLFWQARVRVRGAAGHDMVNGQQWTAGYTGTQIMHGHHHRFGVKLFVPGRTLCFYGDHGTQVTHVAVYVGNGLVVSHGSEAGPLLVPYNYRRMIEARAYAL